MQDETINQSYKGKLSSDVLTPRSQKVAGCQMPIFNPTYSQAMSLGFQHVLLPSHSVHGEMEIIHCIAHLPLQSTDADFVARHVYSSPADAEALTPQRPSSHAGPEEQAHSFSNMQCH